MSLMKPVPMIPPSWELLIKIAGLLVIVGLLLGKLDAIEARVKRIENLMDAKTNREN